MRKDGGRALLDALPANADQVQHLLDSSKQELDSAQGTAKSTKRRVQNVAVCEKVPTYQPDLQRDAFAVEVINRVLHGLATCKPDDGAPASEKTCSPRKMNVDTHLRQTTTNPRLPPKSAKGRIPAADAKKHRQQPKASTVATPTASLIACASSAFRCLRDARKHAPGSASGVDSKLETGMLAFIGRLLALGHTETAIVELEALQTLLHCRFNNPGKSQNEDSGTKAANGKCSSILPSLLSFESVPDTPLCLTIATNFQILVLRAMLSTRFAMPTESVSQSLEDASPCSPCSPVTLLLRLAQHPTARDQACRSLETVAHLIFALCPSLSSSADELALDRERSPSPSTSFRLQRIYLHAQVSWMHMAGHEGNIDDEIYKPLLRCCKAYARRSQQDAANKYIVLKHSVEGIFNALRTSQLHGDGPARTELYEYLSKVASSVGRNIEAATFLANGSAADTNSTVSRIKLLVKLASLKLRTSPDRLLIDQVNEIAELLMIVQQSASLPPDELMSVMQDLLHLGQIVLPILSTRTQTSSEEAESVREITSCFTIFEAIITTLTRLSALTDEKFRMSAHMVIKTLTFFASSSQASRCIRFGELRIALEQCSQVCAIISSQDVPTVALSAMASTATLPSKTERSPGVATAEKIDMSLRTSASGLSMEQTSLIAISNAYWTLSKQHPEAIMTSDVAVEGMWASLRCLEYQPMEVVKAGQFTNKCLKLGQLLQSLERYQDAASVYTMVIKALVRLDCLVVITNAVSSHSTLQAWAATEDTGHLWQAIESLLQLAARHHVGLPEGQVYYDHIDLNVVQRAALLERQLYLDGKWQKSRILKNRERNIRSAILSTLLQLYDMIRYPVRRARICLHIFRLFIDHAGDLEADVFDAAKAFAAAVSPSDFALDISLRQAWDHFHVSVAAIAGMLENNDDENIYNKVVSGWEDLLQGDKSIADLVLRLDNVRSWRDQVIMLIDYLHFHGFFLLELRAVRVLTRLYELQDTKDTAEISYRIRAGRLLLQLGHTSEAGVHLMRARDNFHEASPIPKDILVAHELAFAAYYTDLGNADHRYFIVKGAPHATFADS
jgi:separase